MSNIRAPFADQASLPAVEWTIGTGLQPYAEAVAAMEERVAAIREGQAPEWVWLVEHPPLYTAGTSAKPADLLAPDRFPVFATGRGGQYTYHGPGQRVAYVMLDLRARRLGVKDYVCRLEDWIIATLARFGLKGERRDGRIGIWVDRGPDGMGGRREDKIAAIGVRVRRWVSFHGIAINVEPDLSHFGGIVPCGIAEHGVTSLVDLGYPVTMDDLDVALRQSFEAVFGEGAGQRCAV
ncbi:MAG: lipoyl(octanoyl) transferase LipB [Alphaproteobacteria bacterium]|nr:lipoyl(octanoyl) transferase LipB [Alphaproteobacteria bacterium]MCB9930049.1 lipoyl(octanoyl) transferase LipB [Alphaproteobacteria bacterium]